jgi:hypothetical protein
MYLSLLMDDQRMGMGLLGEWQVLDGAFHCLTANREGSKISVRRYVGDVGTLDVTPPVGVTGPVTIEAGWFSAADRLIDLILSSRTIRKRSPFN